MSNRSAAIRAYSALLIRTISPFTRRRTWTVLSSRALRKPSSMKIKMTAKATPETATIRRRGLCVRFWKASGVRISEQLGRVGAVGFADGGQAGDDTQDGSERQNQ